MIPLYLLWNRRVLYYSHHPSPDERFSEDIVVVRALTVSSGCAEKINSSVDFE